MVGSAVHRQKCTAKNATKAVFGRCWIDAISADIARPQTGSADLAPLDLKAVIGSIMGLRDTAHAFLSTAARLRQLRLHDVRGSWTVGCGPANHRRARPG